MRAQARGVREEGRVCAPGEGVWTEGKVGPEGRKCEGLGEGSAGSERGLGRGVEGGGWY